jgi:ABC-type multidrug transport system fused ATPase/permease subunit
MTSIERILEYSSLKSETFENDKQKKIKTVWPSEGKISFENFSFRYKKNGQLILRNLDFNVESKEKIAVIGRTGAGKTSIVNSLLRTAESEGIIKIDGLNINEICLRELRDKISLIPVS